MLVAESESIERSRSTKVSEIASSLCVVIQYLQSYIKKPTQNKQKKTEEGHIHRHINTPTLINPLIRERTVSNKGWKSERGKRRERENES